MDSGLALRAPRNDGVETRVIAPVLRPAKGTPVFFSVSPKGRAERLGGEPRPRRPHVVSMRTSRLPFGWRAVVRPIVEERCAEPGPRKQVFACVPHTAVLSACNSQRRHALGALTECLASPHCWVLGPPTPSAGRRPFTTLRRAPPARPARKAHRRDGSVASRSAPATRPARLLTGAGRRQSISETAKLSIYEKQKFDHEAVRTVALLLSSPGSSMSRSKNGVASLAYGTPLRDALSQCPPKRDGRVKPGHDSDRLCEPTGPKSPPSSRT